MLILIVSLFVLAIVAAIAGYIRNRKLEKQLGQGEIKEIPALNPVDMECCGQHEVCVKDSLLAAVSKDIEYYDDEELDRFKGRESSSYSEQEENEFRDIFYTMMETDVAGWVRSLMLRGIALPDAVKDEVFLIIGERRI